MYMYYPKTMGFPGGLVVKNQPANAVDTDSIPGSFYPKSLQMVTAAMKLKDAYSLE